MQIQGANTPPFFVIIFSPFELKNLENESSPGYNFVPRKSMCSQKCANPGMSTGSEHAPTRTDIEAAAAVDVGSEQSSTRRLLLGRMYVS